MGGDGWLPGWPKRQKLRAGRDAPPLAVCFHRVISRWPLLVLESPSPSPQPPSPRRLFLFPLLRLLSSSPTLPPGKKGHGLNTTKCPCPTFPQPQGMPLPVAVECGIGTGNLTWQRTGTPACSLCHCVCVCVPFVVRGCTAHMQGSQGLWPFTCHWVS